MDREVSDWKSDEGQKEVQQEYIFSNETQQKIEKIEEEALITRPRDKISYIKRLIKVLHVYIKIFMGRKLDPIEADALNAYLGHKRQENKDNMNKMHYQVYETGNYVNEFDYHSGDLVLRKKILKKNSGSQNIEGGFLQNNQPEEEEIEVQSRKNSLPLIGITRQKDSNAKVLKKQKLKKVISADSQVSDDVCIFYRSGAVNDPIDKAVNQISTRLTGVEQLDNRTRSMAIKEALQIDYSRLKKEHKRIMIKGNYLVEEIDGITKQWRRSEADTSDFLTLIRNILIFQICKQGFVIRSFLSSNSDKIFCVLYQSDDNLKIVAEKHSITKKLNFQFSDLLSLEPVDNSWRPMRLNNRLWKPKQYSTEQISNKFLYLRPKIIQLLKEINFKLIAREVNISQLNQSLFSDTKQDKQDLLQDEQGPSDEQWTAYYQYLLYLKEKILDVRQEQIIFYNKTKKFLKIRYLFRNDDSLMINNQKSSFELYLKRNKEQKNEIRAITEEELEAAIMGGAQGLQFIQCQPPNKQKHLLSITKITEEFRKIQERYKEVKLFLDVPKDKMIGTKHIKSCKREKLASEYLQIFKDALNVVNYKNKILRTLWDSVGENPFEMYVEYTMTPSRIAFSQKTKMNSVWMKYQICETGKTSLFSPMERIKINNLSLNENINWNPLFNQNFVIQMFCVNDNFELLGKTQQELFIDLYSRTIYIPKLLQYTQYDYFVNQIEKIAQQQKFTHRIYTDSDMVQIKQNQYYQRDFKFVQPKINNLAFQWEFNIKKPWYIPTEQIREYYGEKIALYFTYLGFYTKMLLPIGLLGLAFNIWMIYIDDNLSTEYIYATIIFGMIKIQWVNMMYALWQSEEYVFAVKYGQLSSNDSGTNGSQRSSFKGEYSRSIENDSLNSLSYSFFKKFLRTFLAIVALVLIIFIYSLAVLGLFFLTQYLITSQDMIEKNRILKLLKLEVTIPALINLIIILMLDGIYDKLTEELTDFENHETISEYEMGYVFKKYFLQFLSLYGPLFSISFINDLVGLKCIQNDCYLHTQYYFSTIFLFQFSLNIWEIIKPKLILWMNSIALKKINASSQQKDLDQIQQKISLGSQKSLSHRSDSREAVFLEYIDSNPFEKINNFIEQESYKESYVITPERYGTVDDYMEITLQYSMISLLGITFPLCFFIAFIWNALELQTDKIKLINYMQRPLPLGEHSIGVWNGVLEILSYASLLQNSGLIAFLASRAGSNGFGLGALGFFLLILNINFLLNFMENSIFAEVPYSIRSLMNRHKYILHSTIDKFRGSHIQEDEGGDDHTKHVHKHYPIFKTYGCVLEGNQQGEDIYEDMSSEDELEDHYILTPQEKELLKDKRKKYNLKENPNIQELNRQNQLRRSNWAFKFKFKNPTDQTVQQKAKAFYEKTLNFLFKVRRLQVHKLNWTDDRLNDRYFFLRRSKVLIRNLDWRRMLIMRNHSEKLKVKHSLKMQNKYKNKLQIIMDNPELEQNKIDLDEIIEKSTKYIEKHTWIDLRKTVCIKLKGVIFNNSRKYTKPQTAKQIMENYKKLHKHYKKHEEKILKDQTNEIVISVDEQVGLIFKNKRESQLKDINLKDFNELLQKIIPERVTKQHVQLASKEPSQLELTVDGCKSLWHRILTRPLGQLQFALHSEKEEMAFEFYLNHLTHDKKALECVKNNSPRLHLVKLLDRGATYSGFYHYVNTYRWLACLSSIQNPNLDAMNIIIYTEVEFHRNIPINLINNVMRQNAIRNQPGKLPFRNGLIIPQLNYVSLSKSDPIDRTQAHLIKGYFARSYSLQSGYFINGLTLRDVLQMRLAIDLFYSDNDIYDFLNSALKTLEILELQFGLFHGAISPGMFYLAAGWDPTDASAASYALLDIGGLYCYNFRSQEAMFMRCIAPEEIIFASPELIKSYLGEQGGFDPLKSDIYSLGLVVFEMITLGKMSQELVRNLPQNNGDVALTVQQWLYNQTQIEEKYPMTYKLLREMTSSSPSYRLIPSQMTKHMQVSIYADRSLSTFMFSLSEFPDKQLRVLNLYRQPKLVVNTKNQTLRGFQLPMSEYIKENLHRLNFYLRVKAFENLIDIMKQFEKNIEEDFLKKIPFQNQQGTFLDMLEIYVTNQFYEVFFDVDSVKDLMNLFRYLILNLQLKVKQGKLIECEGQSYRVVQLFDFCCKRINKVIHDAKKYKNKQPYQATSQVFTQSIVANNSQFGSDIISSQIPVYNTVVDEEDQSLQKLLSKLREHKSFKKYLLKIKQKLTGMIDDIETMMILMCHLQQEYEVSVERVQNLIDIKIKKLYLQRDELQSVTIREEPIKKRDIPINYELYTVKVSICGHMIKYLKLRLMKLQLLHDLLKYEQFLLEYQILQDELDLLQNKILLNSLPYKENSTRDKIFIQGCNFSELPEEFRLSFLSYVQHMLIDVNRLYFTINLQTLRLLECERNLSKLQQGLKTCLVCPNTLSILSALVNYALQSHSDSLYIQLSQQICNKLTQLYLLDQFFIKNQHQVYMNCSQFFFFQIYLIIGQNLQYIPARQLMEITSQGLDISKNSQQQEIGKLSLSLSTYLRLVAIQYTPNLHYCLNTDSRLTYNIGVDSKNPNSLLHLCRTTQLDLFKCNLLASRKLFYLWWNIYSCGQIHAENSSNDLKDTRKEFFALLEQVSANEYNSKLEQQFKLVQLQISNCEFINMEMIQQEINNLQEEERINQFKQNIQSMICYIVVIQQLCSGIKWKDFLRSSEYEWSMSIGNQPYFFMVPFLHVMLQSGQSAIVRNVTQLLTHQLSHSLLVRVEFNRRTKELFLLWALASQNDNSLKPNILSPKSIKKITLKPETILETQLPGSSEPLLIPQILTQEQCGKIIDRFYKLDPIQPCNEQTIFTLSATLKVIFNFISNTQYERSLQISNELESKLYDYILSIMQNTISLFKSQRIYVKPNNTNISEAQLSSILKLKGIQGQRIQMLFLENLEKMEMLLEVGCVQEYIYLQQISGIFKNNQAAISLCQLRTGNSFSCHETMYQWSKPSSLNLIVQACQIQIKTTMWEHSQSLALSMELLSILCSIEDNQFCDLYISKFKKVFKQQRKEEPLRLLFPERYNPQFQKNNQDIQQETPIYATQVPQLGYIETLFYEVVREVWWISDLKHSTIIQCVECLLNDPKKLVLSVPITFSLQDYSSQFYGYQSFQYARALHMISAMYLQFCYGRQLKILDRQMNVNSENKLKTLKKEYRKICRAYISYKINDKPLDDLKVKKQDLLQAIGVCEQIKNGFSVQQVIKWALIAIEQSQEIYENLVKLYKTRGNSYIFQLYVLKSDCYFFQEKVMNANESLQHAQETLSKCFSIINHPDYVLFYLKLALAKQFIKKCICSQINTLIKIKSIPSITKMQTIFDLMQQDKSILKFFDDYRNHGFQHFIESGLNRYFEQKHQFKYRKQFELQVTRKDHKEVVEIIEYLQEHPKQNQKIEEIFDKSLKALQRDKIKLDFIGLEQFDQARVLCQTIFTSYNNKLHKKVEELLQKAMELQQTQSQLPSQK